MNSRSTAPRSLVKNLGPQADGPVTVSGWVETVRDQKKVQFVVLRDETGAVQLVNPRVAAPAGDASEDASEQTASAAEPEGGNDQAQESQTEASVTGVVTDPAEIAETISNLSQGSFVTITGDLKHDERVKLGGIEVKVGSIQVHSRAIAETPIKADSSVDKRMDWRFLDLRLPQNRLIFEVQTTFEHALRTYWVEHGFIEIHTPKIMASPSESNAELFKLEYFDGVAYLAQSPQFFKQMAQSAGFGGIFEIGPAFRADPSFTSRHATEFVSVDTEISWIDSHEDVMRLQENLLVAGLAAVKAKHGDAIKELFDVDVVVPTLPFPRIPLLEAKRIVAERGYMVPREDDDMDPEGERQIWAYVEETFGHEFVFLTDYPASIRAFYHMRHEDDPTLTKSYDLIWRGVEITTGAQREHRVEVLEQQAREKGLDPEQLSFYFDFFRYGVPPHGGFGMGLGRVLMLMLHRSSLREVSYLFRGPNRLAP